MKKATHPGGSSHRHNLFFVYDPVIRYSDSTGELCALLRIYVTYIAQWVVWEPISFIGSGAYVIFQAANHFHSEMIKLLFLLSSV